METIWYAILAAMLAVYVVLDGFDLGAGALHLFVAKNERERREVLAAIGPFWDGNEVWLLAAGGVFFLAFPRAYAAAFSGFYLPLMIALWLLVLRGLAIEFRGHHEHPRWHKLCDNTFAGTSALIAVLLGAALGNIVRGLPIDETGFFSLPLITNLRPGLTPGVLDWYTITVGIFALLTLTAHGALFLAGKTTGEVHDRNLSLASWLWSGVALCFVALTVATAYVQPMLFAALRQRPWTWALALITCLGFSGVVLSLAQKWARTAFGSSAIFIAGLLATTAAGLYPAILPSLYAPSLNLTVNNTAASGHGLRTGLIWWLIALPPVISYSIYLYRIFSSGRGKVKLDGHY